VLIDTADKTIKAVCNKNRANNRFSQVREGAQKRKVQNEKLRTLLLPVDPHT
jgi:hypothetical protein